jgi:dihydrofolate reductase
VTTDASKLTIHMVASLDGFIAKADNDIAWLQASSRYERGVDFGDVEAFLATIGCYVMGSRTYEHAVELSREHGWAYGDKPTIVLTHRKLPEIRATVEFYEGDLRPLVEDLRARFTNVWLVGGAALVKDALRLGLVDDIRLSIVPILIGGGTPFFDHVGERALRLKDVTAYQNGMVELWYELERGSRS